MNKKTPLIKNYTLLPDVLYLEYQEEDYCYKNHIGKNIIYKDKVFIAKHYEANGGCFYGGEL